VSSSGVKAPSEILLQNDKYSYMLLVIIIIKDAGEAVLTACGVGGVS